MTPNIASFRSLRALATLILVTGTAVAPSACSSSEPAAPEASDASGADASRDGTTDSHKEAVAPIDMGAPVSACGGKTCALTPVADMSGFTICCTADQRCGAMVPGGTSCLLADAPGGLDPTCPDASDGNGGSLPGCCTAQGQCGGLATGVGLGCVAQADLGGTPKACTFDPAACSHVVGVSCDGPEDCPSGKTCCGDFDGNGYTHFGCFDSCAAATGGGPNDQWYELCHAGQTCQDGSECLTSHFLPGSLARCFTSGSPAPADTPKGVGVNCGSATCAAGEQCCLRMPHDAYCAPADQACACAGPATSVDGGADAEAGVDAQADVGPSSDASDANDASDATDAADGDASSATDAPSE